MPPSPPHTTLILGGSKPPKSGPPRARISPVFCPLRCKVVGGWGGSAHYPDPTAQSAPVPPPRRARSPGPAQPACQTCENAKFLLFAAKFAAALYEVGEVGVSEIRCANVSHGRGPLRSPRPCPEAEVLTDGSGVISKTTWEGLACSARHFRTLPVTPVVSHVWLSQTASSFSQPHGPARTSVLALREDLFRRERAPHSAVRPADGSRR